MSKTQIKVINLKFINEKMQYESLTKQAEYKNKEYILNINKSFDSISEEMIRDEVVFMPICKKGYCMFSICSFKIEEFYEKKLITKLNEIALLYINSEMEKYEMEIEEIETKINNLRNIVTQLEN